MTDHPTADQCYQLLVHQADARLGQTWTELLRERYGGHRVILATDYQQAAHRLETESLDFCVVDLDAAGGTDLFFDLRTVLPDVGVLLTSARLPGERPALSPEDELRVLHVIPASTTPTILCETLGEILGLEAVVKTAAPPEPPGGGSSVPPQTRRLTGNLQILLPDLVQLKCLTGRSCILEIGNGQDAGQIYFEQGNIVHACTRHLEGLPALLSAFGWKNSHFRERPWCEPPSRSVHHRWETVLLEISRMTDEAAGPPAGHLLEAAPAADQLRAA